jgi:hypothetical protein
MSGPQTATWEVREAVADLHRYLSDEVAPLTVLEAVEALLRQPPVVMARAIEAWTSAHLGRLGESSRLSDCFYHAFKKLHLMGEFKLVPREQLRAYLDGLAALMIEAVPPEEQEDLRTELERLGRVVGDISVNSNKPLMVHTPGMLAQGAGLAASPADGDGAALSAMATRGLRRFRLLLERLGAGAPSAGSEGIAVGPASPSQEALLSRILTTAAVSSTSSNDLDQFLAQLREQGLDAKAHEIFQALGRSLPAWFLPGIQGTAGSAPTTAPPVEAMRRLIAMAPNSVELAYRFSELMQSATARFNEGDLARSAQMFDLAGGLIAEKRVDELLAKRIRETGHEALSEARLGEYAEAVEKHALLRLVLGFFPAFSPLGLYDALDVEERRERRRLYLSLLEVHGAPARAEALRLLGSGERQLHYYLQRNLLHMLRRIPRPADANLDEELACLDEHSRPDHEPMVVKEALVVLSQTRHPRVDQILRERFRQYEQLLLAPGARRVDPGEALSIIDRIASALARTGDAAGIRAVVEHGLKRQPQLGDTVARLADLASRDLKGDPAVVARLIEALRAELPKKVLGLVVHRGSEGALHLVRALSGTATNEVRSELESIVSRYPDIPVAEAAAKALTELGLSARPQDPAATMILTGDLELFGLPSLLQTLADSQVSGNLTLIGADGKAFGSMLLVSGRLLDCRTGELTGTTAFYQLFEKPSTGSFTMRGGKGAPAEETDPRESHEVMHLLLEAMRRQDEYQSACLLVPDHLVLDLTGSKPTRPAEETDTDLLRRIWAKVRAGATAAECETAAGTDSYRSRRILAHWLEEGSVQARGAGGSAVEAAAGGPAE